ncbi:tellurite methyltransferase TehB [Gottschalkia acidurici 9a]|uniref:Tellurite methyltransferase TehB n=1 Tax=Gottschalkia acidurici (strain ATCC 7906 / DSM 604 / BCRC 14475 / CIP 104303 / KCTC 5404 / NCIMB 10678 / 9a) TaxID=1128398 RepID=K0AY52_GOTA9|nr:methyltransferase domain-containing protein [Gottschalkia acidurici]AFS78713.1 tellurite methyltransferase TehB [Gottschalkia acidurici 9a]
MKDESNREHWSEKYRQRDNELKEPSFYIKNNISFLNKGSLLDLACGDGRNAIFLSKYGFDVTGVDFSEEAIKRLLYFSELNHVSINTKIFDLDNISEITRLGKFDNIIISCFKPTLEMFKILPQLLNKNGIIILCSFNFRQAEEKEFPRKYCLEENEFINVSDELILIKYDHLIEERGYLDGYIFKLK